MKNKIYAVDLFCGAGGLSYGLAADGIKIVAGIDIDYRCKFVYEKNIKAKFIHEDLSKISPKTINDLYPKNGIKLLAGCAPCQPFSTYNQGKDARSNDKWGLLDNFANIAKEIKPEIITMENVPQLTKHEVYNNFVNELKDLGYNITTTVVYCPDYGIPQMRKRLVLLASIIGEISLIPPIHTKKNYITVRQAIGKLSPLKAGESSKTDPVHVASAMTKMNLDRIRASKPGGSWKNWDNKLIANCHKKDAGKRYGSVYGRMEWDKPSPTITTQCTGFGNGRFGHPEQDRALSLREAAILQTFPENYKFFDEASPLLITSIRRMIGNAVPVKLGEAIAKSINNHLKESYV